MRREQDPKFVYYLSAEFLMGRSLTNSVFNLGIDGPYAEAVKKMGYKLEELVDAEQNAVRSLDPSILPPQLFARSSLNQFIFRLLTSS